MPLSIESLASAVIREGIFTERVVPGHVARIVPRARGDQATSRFPRTVYLFSAQSFLGRVIAETFAAYQ